MSLYRRYGRPLVISLIVIKTLLITSACSGITPESQLRNNREEGPERGLLSGPEGEFVILVPASGATNKKEGRKEAVKNQQ